MTSASKTLIEVYQKGYRVIDGDVYNPKGRKIDTYTKRGYRAFSVRTKNVNSVCIYVHRLVAYQKYGKTMLEKGIVTRHLDGNRSNNTDTNIAIGTQKDNWNDQPRDRIIGMAIYAASKRRKFSDSEICDIKNFHAKDNSYKKTMDKFNITSKGTLHHVLTHDYMTNKID